MREVIKGLERRSRQTKVRGVGGDRCQCDRRHGKGTDGARKNWDTETVTIRSVDITRRGGSSEDKYKVLTRCLIRDSTEELGDLVYLGT